MIERFAKFSFVISEIHRHILKISSDEMRKHGLSGTQARYLIIMHRHKAGITATRLGVLCDRNKADVSRAISLLEKKEMIERESPTSNYRVKLRLTEKGKETARIIRERAELAVRLVGGSISDEHREIIYDSLALIAEKLETISKNGLPEELPTEEKPTLGEEL